MVITASEGTRGQERSLQLKKRSIDPVEQGESAKPVLKTVLAGFHQEEFWMIYH
jgi:hypothetical protein